jgi:hypothetical protein
VSCKLRARLTVLAVAAVLLSVFALAARAQPLSNVVDLALAFGSPYAPVVALSGSVLLALCRRIRLSVAAVTVIRATLAVQVPWYYFGHPADVGQHVEIRVLPSNLRKGQADASSFVGFATGSADVITVSELTPDEVRRLSRAGIDEVFPYSMLLPGPGAGGIGLWSRYPLAAAPPTKRQNPTIAAARMWVPGVRFELLVASLHITSLPWLT